MFLIYLRPRPKGKELMHFPWPTIGRLAYNHGIMAVGFLPEESFASAPVLLAILKTVSNLVLLLEDQGIHVAIYTYTHAYVHVHIYTYMHTQKNSVVITLTIVGMRITLINQ